MNQREQAKNDQGKRYMSVKETARYLGISEKSIYAKTHRNAPSKFPIPFKRVGRLIKFDKEAVDRYMNGNDGDTESIAL